MRVPFWLQGALFVPLLIALLFVVGVRSLLPPVFLPIVLFQSLFGGIGFVARHEMAFVFIYWAFVGALVGLCFDIFHPKTKTASSQSAVQEAVV